MKAEIIRVYQPEQTLGFLVVKDKNDIITFSCCTLELPWLDNRRNISCIPEGEYTVTRRAAHEKRKYTHFHVRDVPGRSYILLHTGNFNFHVQGCILPGKYHSDLNNDGLLDVVESTNTLKKMVKIMPDKFTLKIRS